MITISELIAEVTGSGLSDEELLELSSHLILFADIKEKIISMIGDLLQEDVNEILVSLVAPSEQQKIMALAIECLAPKEKEYYLKHTIQHKSIGQIAKEFGVARGTVQWSIERSRQKIERVKQGERFAKRQLVKFLS